MKKNIHLIIGVIIATVTIYYTFRNVSIREITHIIASIKYFYLIPALMSIAMTFVFRAYRWSYLVSSVCEVEVKDLYSPLMIGFMGNLLPARAGEFIRAYLLGKNQKIHFSASFATIFVERLFDIFGILIIASGLLFFKDETFSKVIVFKGLSLTTLFNRFGLISIGTILFIIAFSLLLLYCKNFINTVIQYITRPLPAHITEKTIHIIHSFSEGLNILKDFKGMMWIIIYTIGTWASIIASNYIFFKVFEIDNLPFIAVPLLTVMVCISITLLPTPGYVGSFQAGCIIALHNIFQVPEPVAASFGVLTWFINMGFVTFFGTYFIFKDNISLTEITHAEKE